MKDHTEPIRHKYTYGGRTHNIPSSLSALIEALCRFRAHVLKAGHDPDEILLRYLDGTDLDADIEKLELVFFPDEEIADLLVSFSGRTCSCSSEPSESREWSPRWLGPEIVC